MAEIDGSIAQVQREKLKSIDFKQLNDMQKIAHIADIAKLAPSLHNTQPWEVLVKNSSITIIPQYAKSLPRADKDGQGLMISIGCYIGALKIAAAHFGYDAHYSMDESGIRVGLSKGGVSKKLKITSDDVYGCLFTRSTYKGIFQQKKLDDSLFGELKKNLANVVDCECHVIEDGQKRAELKELHLRALVGHGRKFLAEFAPWLRSSNSRELDGMPASSFPGMNDKKLVVFKLLARLRLLKPNNRLISAESRRFDSAHAAVVLVAGSDDKQRAIEIGIAHIFVQLYLDSQGADSTPMYAMISDSETRAELASLLSTDGVPRMVFLAGVAANKNNKFLTPRKGLG